MRPLKATTSKSLTFGHGVYWDIVARPEIRSIGELRGKNLGVTNIGGTTWIGGATLGLEHFKLNPERDRIQLQGIGDQTVLLQARTRPRGCRPGRLLLYA